jgi:aldehyde dehydrogenase
MPTMTKVHPGAYGFPVSLKQRYDNYIGGKWTAPASGEYFDNITPVTGQVICQIARSNATDVERALDAAHAAETAWGKTSQAERGRLLERIAQRIEDNLEMLATIETWDNGKPIRETMAADLPLAVDHFRYFGGVGGIDQRDRLDHGCVPLP